MRVVRVGVCVHRSKYPPGFTRRHVTAITPQLASLDVPQIEPQLAIYDVSYIMRVSLLLLLYYSLLFYTPPVLRWRHHSSQFLLSVASVTLLNY